jgi:hypothetical protein
VAFLVVGAVSAKPYALRISSAGAVAMMRRFQKQE